MITGTEYWNSITMTPDQFKQKYESDKDFWEKNGEVMYKRMVEYEESKKINTNTELTEKERWLSQ